MDTKLRVPAHFSGYPRKPIEESNFAGLVYLLMTELQADTDMSIIQAAVSKQMENSDLTFKDYKEFIGSFDNDEITFYFSKFDSTEDYFFEYINTKAITLGRVQLLVSQTILGF
jgi:hypothetical protein